MNGTIPVKGKGWQMQSDACVFASTCRTDQRPERVCMEVVTGKSCVFMARFQMVPIPPNTAAFLLSKRVCPSGHSLVEPEGTQGGILRGQIRSQDMTSHMP